MNSLIIGAIATIFDANTIRMIEIKLKNFAHKFHSRTSSCLCCYKKNCIPEPQNRKGLQRDAFDVSMNGRLNAWERCNRKIRESAFIHSNLFLEKIHLIPKDFKQQQQKLIFNSIKIESAMKFYEKAF